MAGRPICPVCGEVIGIYEPLLVVGHGVGRASSLAREPLLASSEDTIVHRACAADLATNGDGALAAQRHMSASE